MAYTDHWIGSPWPKLPVPHEPFASDVEDVLKRSMANVTPVLFLGPVGTGKTVAMARIFAHHKMRDTVTGTKGWQRTWLEANCVWVSADELVQDVRVGWNKAQEYKDFDDRYSAEGLSKYYERLYLDDLGSEGNRDGNVEIITRIIQARHNLNRHTWVTSNLSIEEMEKRYTERITSRLMHHAELVTLTGGDRRLQ